MHRTKQISGYQKQSGVFARGISDSGGVVGCADIVIHDSPPLTGCTEETERNFNNLGCNGVPGYTALGGWIWPASEDK